MILIKQLKLMGISIIKWMGIYEWQRTFRKIPFSIRMANLIAQKIIRLNANSPWQVHFTSRVIHPKNIQLSKSAQLFLALSGGCYFNGQSGITIEEGTIIAPGVKIVSSNHCLCDFSKHESSDRITIGRNCWLGTSSVVLPGVVLGDHVIVAAGAVVTRSFPANTLIGGVPASKIKDLPPYNCTDPKTSFLNNN